MRAEQMLKILPKNDAIYGSLSGDSDFDAIAMYAVDVNDKVTNSAIVTFSKVVINILKDAIRNCHSLQTNVNSPHFYTDHTRTSDTYFFQIIYTPRSELGPELISGVHTLHDVKIFQYNSDATRKRFCVRKRIVEGTALTLSPHPTNAGYKIAKDAEVVLEDL